MKMQPREQFLLVQRKAQREILPKPVAAATATATRSAGIAESQTENEKKILCK